MVVVAVEAMLEVVVVAATAVAAVTADATNVAAGLVVDIVGHATWANDDELEAIFVGVVPTEGGWLTLTLRPVFGCRIDELLSSAEVKRVAAA